MTGHLRARLSLLAIEAGEARRSVIWRSVFVLAAFVFLTAAVIFLGAAGAYWLVETRYMDPSKAVLIVGGLFLALGLIAGFLAWLPFGKGLFRYSREEFRKDQEMLLEKKKEDSG